MVMHKHRQVVTFYLTDITLIRVIMFSFTMSGFKSSMISMIRIIHSFAFSWKQEAT